MKKKLNIEKWNRKKHFLFFKEFDNPFYNICFNIDVTNLINCCRNNNLSFFLSSLYLSTRAANSVNELKYRIEGKDVYIYDMIHPFSTVLNDDNTFSFCEFQYIEDYGEFVNSGKISIERIKRDKDLLPKEERNDVFHFTTIPWISHTSVSHARKFGNDDCIPKMVFGKYFNDNSRIMIPFSIEVHHSLVDGFHIGQFSDKFNELIHRCENILI